MFDELIRAIRDKEDLPDAYRLAEYNTISVKLDFPNPLTKTLNKTMWHTDITRNKETNQPKPNNSQTPDTPVIIFTWSEMGAYKELWFGQGPDEKKNIVDNTQFSFRQNNSNFIVLDGRDEHFVNGKAWHHMSQFPAGGKSMIASIMLRVVQSTQEIKKDDDTLANKPPDKPGYSNQRAEYTKAKEYQAHMNELQDHLERLCNVKIH